MAEPRDPETQTSDNNESFGDILAQYEKDHAKKPEEGARQLQGTIVAVNAESVFFDIGYKTEGILPRTAFREDESVTPGDKFPVSVKGRNPEGYYELSRTRVETPKDWPALERAFAAKSTIMGTVTAAVKGGLSVDVGVRAFMPASRSGTKDAAEMEKLVGTEIRCRITKLDVADEDVVVDRRAVLEEEERGLRERRYSELQEGETVTGTVRTLTDYGAFVDIGGVDALLHVGDLSWSRVNSPADVLAVGQQVEARVLKVDAEKKRVSIGMKQLQAHPWEAVPGKYKIGERVRGTVSRVVDFGAFVEVEPGVEGLVHISELSWGRKVRKVTDVVQQGDTVEAVILGIDLGEERMSLGLKQALGDPWKDAPQKFAAGSVVTGPVTSLAKFGAFVQLAEGVEGLVHVSEISAERRINHPQDVLKVGQTVQAQVLSIDPEKRLIRLSMKQLAPTGLDEYLEEHKNGDVVTGRLTEISGSMARVELGEGVPATCVLKAAAAGEATVPAKTDLGSLSSMLQAKWKGAGSGPAKPEPPQAGQIRSFKITRIDTAEKKIEVELA
jgi:small subunit ribosomal protein S1